jgi:ectoine hydroxylase-related dioxygenase (phytanoyl-CoA dioxygenase family)
MNIDRLYEPLTSDTVSQKRHELVDLGVCIIPGVLSGDLLERVRRFSDDFLEEHAVAHTHRYQGSDFHVITEEKHRREGLDHPNHNPIADELIGNKRQIEAAKLLGLEGLRSDETFIILDKPAGGPALYWHQDGMDWNHPRFALPWPTRIFFSYYLVDTSRENGCLRTIPGTHRKRIPLHDVLPAAHGPEIQSVDETHQAFIDHPDEIDLPVSAGDLVIADTRVLHAAWPNKSDQRRTLILQWWDVFPFPSVPSWWDGELPAELSETAPDPYEHTRIPGDYLRP